jgi:hypothetical protein
MERLNTAIFLVVTSTKTPDDPKKRRIAACDLQIPVETKSDTGQVSWREVNPGCEIPTLVTLDDDEAQTLFDDLWDGGFRPHKKVWDEILAGLDYTLRKLANPEKP